MISLEVYKEALGEEIKDLSDEQILNLKTRQEKLADMLFDLKFYNKAPP